MAKTPKPVEELSYEQALEELDGILVELEGEAGDLEVTLSRFERGRALIQRCQELLDMAELKVRRLSEDGGLTNLEEQE